MATDFILQTGEMVVSMQQSDFIMSQLVVLWLPVSTAVAAVTLTALALAENHEKIIKFGDKSKEAVEYCKQKLSASASPKEKVETYTKNNSAPLEHTKNDCPSNDKNKSNK